MSEFSNDKLNALLQQQTTADTVKAFVTSFIPLCIAIIGVFLYLEYIKFDEHREITLSTEQERADVAKAFLIHDLEILTTDLEILADDPDFNRWLNSEQADQPLLRSVEKHFLSFIRVRSLYDQIRFLDAQGQEKLRINYNNGTPSIVGEPALQNKADRYYFKDSIVMPKGQVYLSPLDLNMEGGVIEKPHKPVIRAAMTLFNRQGELKGVLIVNYLAEGMLNRFKEWMHPSESVSPQLLNDAGYWLAHMNPEREWGFMFNDDQTFGTGYPGTWTVLQSQAGGTVRTATGVVIYRQLVPLAVVAQVTGQQVDTEAPLNTWYVVSEVTFPLFFEGLLSGRSSTLFVLLFVLMAAALAAREHARWRMRKDLRDSLTDLLFQGMEKSPTTIFITSADGEIEYINEAFETLTGYEAQEVLGQNPRLLKSDNHSDNVYTQLWHAISAGKVWQGRLKNRCKDGSFFWVDAQIAPLFDEKKQIAHYVCIQRDVSELLAQRDELEQRSQQLAFERTKANAANKAKSEFLANMSHEIRTPMNAIIGLTHLLKRDAVKAVQKQRLEKVDNAANYLLTIINDILDLSKIEAGKLTLEQVSFNLNDLLQQIESLLSTQLADKQIRLVIEPHTCPVWLVGDAIRLRQTILNYTGNAIKFTEQGSVTLRVKVLEQEQDDYLLRFEVEDTGIGIKQEKLDKLFQAFQQADSSTTRRFGGTGLGLTISQNLARLMGGTVGASSEEGVGSTFWFTARFKAGTADDTASVNEQQLTADFLASVCKGLPVLLVDDNEINLEVGAELLEIAGFHVDQAENGRIAVEQARSTPYALILMDLQMPEMDGIEATRIIRELPEYQDVPILAMTANVYKEDQAPCLEAGMNDFIPKPVNPRLLYTIIGKWLGVEMEQPQPVEREAGSTDATTTETGDSVPRIDLAALATVFGAKQERQRQVLKKFVPQLQDIRQKIEAAVQRVDCADTAFHAHKLKSSSRMVGANALSDACLALELAGKAGDNAGLEALASTLYQEAALAEQEISDILG